MFVYPSLILKNKRNKCFLSHIKNFPTHLSLVLCTAKESYRLSPPDKIVLSKWTSAAMRDFHILGAGSSASAYCLWTSLERRKRRKTNMWTRERGDKCTGGELQCEGIWDDEIILKQIKIVFLFNNEIISWFAMTKANRAAQ
jgi:hypothetical protein